MTAKRRSCPDMSAQIALTQSARVVGFFALLADLRDIVSGVCVEGEICCFVSGVWGALDSTEWSNAGVVSMGSISDIDCSEVDGIMMTEG